MGWLGVNGIGGYVPFFKNAFDKLGIRAEFEHVEEYKTAYNQFTESGFTPAHREMMESLYGDIFDQYVAAVASARKKTPDEVRALIDRGSFQGEDALEAGLVDDLKYEDELRDMLQERRTEARPDHLGRVFPRQPGGRGTRGRPEGGRDLRRRAHPERGKPAGEHRRRHGGPLDPPGPRGPDASPPSSSGWTAPAARPWPPTSSGGRSSWPRSRSRSSSRCPTWPGREATGSPWRPTRSWPSRRPSPAPSGSSPASSTFRASTGSSA